MRFTLERVTQPEFEPVTLEEMIRQVHEFSSIDEITRAELADLITAGREWVEDYTGRALVEQTWRLTLLSQAGSNAGGDVVGGRSGPGPVNYDFYEGQWRWGRYGEIVLPKAPALSIVNIISVDQAGAETALGAATYGLREADSKWPRLVALNGASWSSGITGDMRITFRAGFTDSVGSPQLGVERIPVRFKQAIKLHAEAHYDRDKDQMEKLLAAAENLIRPERSDLQIA